MNARLAKSATQEQQAKLKQQQLAELVELLTPHPQLRDGSEAQNQGRKSGDEKWRLMRGEMRQTSKESPADESKDKKNATK